MQELLDKKTWSKLFGQTVVFDWKASVDNKWKEKIGGQI
jgi:hypothetical protein